MTAWFLRPPRFTVAGMAHKLASFKQLLGAASRQLITALALSAAALVGIAVNEGYSSKAYPDPTYGTAVPTIGFGTTMNVDGSKVKMGDSITPVAALQRKLADVQKFEGAAKRCIKVALHPVEYDVYIDLMYNIGEGAFCNSTLVKKLNAQDYAGACKQILEWKKSAGHDCSQPGNQVCGGLWKRRVQAYNLCMGAQ
jgi:lysozyme